MIGISTRTFDSIGSIVFEEEEDDSTIDQFSRRISKTKTLDGAVVVEDRGFTHGDRQINVTVKATAAAKTTLEYLIKNYGELLVTTREGAFLTAPSAFVLSREQFTLTFEVKEILSG